MFSSNRNDYVSLTFGSEAVGYDNGKSRKQSLWRTWNRLSSLQRSVICLLTILSMLCALYIVPSFYDDYLHKDEVENLSRKKIGTGSLAHPERKSDDVADKFARDSILQVKKKAQDFMDRKKANVQPLNKRGPPKLQRLEGQVETGKGKQIVPLEGAEESNNKNLAIDKPKEIPAPAPKLVPVAKPNQELFTGPHNQQQQAVVAAFQHAWTAYKKYAWGHDELRPMTKDHSTWFGVGLTLIDSLDTMWIMGLKEEFQEARDWVANTLSFDINKDANLFEITIRCLGGLLSTYHLTSDEIFLQKAKDLGDRLLPAFNTRSKVPYSDVNLKTHLSHAPRWGPDSSTSEVTTIQLEFKDLSLATGDPKYGEMADSVSHHVHTLQKKDGLVPIFINANTGRFRSSGTITLGARGDSYYEYLLKRWLQTGKIDDEARMDYVAAVEGIQKHLIKESKPGKLMFIGELLGGHSFSPKMDHLVCFMGGSLALGAHNGLDQEHMELGKRLTETCFEMYRRMPTGLSPEIVYFNLADGGKDDIIVKPADTHNLERPETVESLFVLYRLTGDKKYRDWGWKIFQSFEKYTKLPEGYSSINNVRSPGNPGYRNKMESFFLGETLKYLYLLFSDNSNLISLDEYVFNTEAHPLPIYAV